MIEHIPDLLEAGIDSFKIEGRMKTALYVATVARTYRKAIDDYLESPEKYQENMHGISNRSKAAHTASLPRDFSTENLRRRHRFTITTRMKRNIPIWELSVRKMKRECTGWNKRINFLSENRSK